MLFTLGQPSQIGSEVEGDSLVLLLRPSDPSPVKIGIPVWLIDQNVTLVSSAITHWVIDPSPKQERQDPPLLVGRGSCP